MSQNPSRRRGPHRAASPGHVPRLRGTRTELRGRWCVRWPGAAPRYRPAGESDTTPGTLRSAPAWTGAQGDGPGLGALAAGPAHFPPPAGTCPHSAGERAPRAGQRSANVPSLAHPFPPPRPSVPPWYLSFLLFAAHFFVPSAFEGGPWAPAFVLAQTGSRGLIHLGLNSRDGTRSPGCDREIPTQEGGGIHRQASSDRLGILDTVIACISVRLSFPLNPIAKSLCSSRGSAVWWAPGALTSSSLTGWGQSRPRGAGTCAGSCSGQLPHPDARLWAPKGARFRLGGPGRLQVPISCRGGRKHVSLGEGRSGVRSAESRRPSHGG